MKRLHFPQAPSPAGGQPPAGDGPQNPNSRYRGPDPCVKSLRAILKSWIRWLSFICKLARAIPSLSRQVDTSCNARKPVLRAGNVDAGDVATLCIRGQQRAERTNDSLERVDNRIKPATEVVPDSIWRSDPDLALDLARHLDDGGKPGPFDPE